MRRRRQHVAPHRGGRDGVFAATRATSAADADPRPLLPAGEASPLRCLPAAPPSAARRRRSARTIETSARCDRATRTAGRPVTAPIVRSGDNEHTSAVNDATTAPARAQRWPPAHDASPRPSRPRRARPPRRPSDTCCSRSPAWTFADAQTRLANAPPTDDDGRHEVAPPLALYPKDPIDRRRMPPDVSTPTAPPIGRTPARRRDDCQAAGRDDQAPHRAGRSANAHEPVGRHGDGGDDGRDQAAVEVRERHCRGRDDEPGDAAGDARSRHPTARAGRAESTAPVRCAGDRPPARGETARSVGTRRECGARAGQTEIAREQVRRHGRQREREEDEPVVGGHGADDPREGRPALR